MRIAIYHNLSSGGAKRSLFEMTSRLADRHEIDVFTTSAAEHNFADIRPFVKNHVIAPFKSTSLLRSPFGRLNQLIYLGDLLRLDRLDRTIAREIDRKRYDVVFAHHCRFRQSPGVLRFLRTPTVYYCQEPPRKLYDPPIPRPYLKQGIGQKLDQWDPLPGLYNSVFRRRDRMQTRSSSTILVNSCHSRESVWRVYGKEPTVCYLGVDVEAFQPVDLPKKNIVLSVGTLNAIKGHDLLVRAIARIPRPERPQLVIISNFGEQREREYVEGLAKDKDVTLEIEPPINDAQQLARWYSRARLTGYTPFLEPLGLVALESMACGTPVVGVREGGLRETVVDGVTGLLADRTPEAVASALCALLSDPERAAELGRKGREWVSSNWTWERTTTCVEHALNEAADRGASAGT